MALYKGLYLVYADTELPSDHDLLEQTMKKLYVSLPYHRPQAIGHVLLIAAQSFGSTQRRGKDLERDEKCASKKQ